MKQCQWCGKEHNKKGLTCSRSCSTSYGNSKKKGLYHKTKEHKTHLSEIHTLQRIKIVKICPKCNSEFEIIRNISKDGNEIIHKKEKKYCSRKCANSHIFTEERKQKISKKLKNRIVKEKNEDLKKEKQLIIKKCIVCDKEFETSNNRRKVCSRSCIGKLGSQAYKDKYTYEQKSEINKKAYKEGRNYIAGGTTKWYEYKNIKVQGTYELRVCKILDQWKDNNLIKSWEYTNDRYKYIGIDGKEHSYLLDFKVINHDDSFYYIEVKGYEKENDKLKWNAIRNLGYKLEVWFKKTILYYDNYGDASR